MPEAAAISEKANGYELANDVNARTEIGGIGEGGNTFEPKVRASLWGGEADFSLRLPTSATRTPQRAVDEKTGKDTITYFDDSTNLGLRVYDQSDDPRHERGTTQLDLILGGIPQQPTLPLALETNGLVGYWQGELSKIEKQRGNIRPADVIGSLAFYHNTRGQIHAGEADAQKYQTGKAFHLYRPLAIDSKGNTHVVEWSFSEDGNELSLQFDDWFATASYPVTIDPTFGFTTLGNTADATGEYLLAQKFTAGGSGDATNFTVGGNINIAGSLATSGGTYADGVTPASTSRLSNATAFNMTSTTKQFWTTALTWVGIVSGTAYHLSVGGRNLSSVETNIAYDTTAGTIYFKPWVYSATMPNPWPSSTDGNFSGTLSIYVTFTTSGDTLMAQICM